MTTLTKPIGTVTLTGTAEKVTLPAFYGWIWIKNMSDSDIFAGLSASVSENADGVMTIPAGECGRLQTDGFHSVYLLGTGNALIVAQNYADCPFKAGAKGGVTVDSELSDTSENPVQNKAVTAAIDKKANEIDLKNVAFSGDYADLSNTPDLTQFAKMDSIPPEINVMTYTVTFSEISWNTTTAGKYVYHIASLNVNKIISVTISEPWSTIASDEIIQPYVRTTTQIALFSNTAKKTGNMSFRIAYV